MLEIQIVYQIMKTKKGETLATTFYDEPNFTLREWYTFKKPHFE